MNRFHSILLMVILAFASSVLATERNFVVGRRLQSGYFDIAKINDEGNYSISGVDSLDGVFFYVEHGWDGPCCATPQYLKFSIGKNLNSKQNDSVWVLTDFTNIDSLHSGLKKGEPLTLENFTKLEFDSTHVQYLVHANNQPVDIEINRNLPKDSAEYFENLDYIQSLSVIHFHDYFLYKKENSVAVLCGIEDDLCYYKIGCFYQNDGSFAFDSLPDPDVMVSTQGCLNGTGSPLPPINQNLNKLNILDAKSYKVNGVPATKASSNIVIQNKQPKLRLKGIY